MNKHIELTKQQVKDKNELEVKFYKIMNDYNLIGWVWKWNTTMNPFGTCDHKNRKIEINYCKALSNTTEAIDTFLHEVAHALTRGHGHDKVWKAKCVELGCRPQAKAPIMKVAENFQTATQLKYTVKCNHCSIEFQKARKTDMTCAACDKNYNPKFAFEWIINKK